MRNRFIIQHRVYIEVEHQAQWKQAPFEADISAMNISPTMTLKLCV